MLHFLGRLHPVLVHLPIGFLMAAGLFQLLTLWHRFKTLKMAVQPLLLLGFLGAVGACVSGYLLSQQEDYDTALVGKHQWMGIAVATASLLALWQSAKGSQRIQHLFAALLLLLITVTGHLGGTLTHGEGYLSFSSETEKEQTAKPITNVQEALVFADVVQPMLQNKCASCHGASKQKGKLRLDDSSFIQKGGKNGAVFTAFDAKESELIKRLLLPREDEHHMPPKEKPQLTKEETALLQWWITTGGSFHKKVNELNQPANIQPLLAKLEKGTTETKAAVAASIEPPTPVEAADPKQVQALQKAGATILPLSKQSNYLSMVIRNGAADSKQLFALLPGLSKQMMELRLSGVPLNDTALLQLAKCTGLRRLFLDGTGITDQQLGRLKTLSQLRFLNLVGNNITEQGLLALRGLPLHSVYLYQTGIKASSWPQLQKAFPGCLLDSGGYALTVRPEDTLRLK